MKVSGFTIIRNAVRFDFPVVEAISSILPIVDDFIVNAGYSDDGTLEIIRSIKSDKIRIIESVWDDSMKKDGLLFSEETNRALAHCTGDWAFYLQADEVVHEQDHERILKALRDNLNNLEVLGFTFRYLHFYGDYYSINPWFYHRAVRIIRNNGEVNSCGDAVGFCLKSDGGYLQSKHRNRLRPSGATIYHYGWVKEPKVLMEKFRYQIARHHGDNPSHQEERLLKHKEFEFPDYEIMKEFRGTHPDVMSERMGLTGPLRPRVNRWLNLRFYKAVLKRGFRG